MHRNPLTTNLSNGVQEELSGIDQFKYTGLRLGHSSVIPTPSASDPYANL